MADDLTSGHGACNRRHVLRRAAGVLAGGASGFVLAREALPDIVQPRRAGAPGFAERAFEMRRLAVERGDQAYGAVVVKDGRIVGEGVSAVLTTPDPTAHAEIQALRDAAKRLGTPDLSGCELYGSSRACPMCEAAAYWARIARMYHGEAATDAGAPRLR